jgi:hypothetical protein
MLVTVLLRGLFPVLPASSITVFIVYFFFLVPHENIWYSVPAQRTNSLVPPLTLLEPVSQVPICKEDLVCFSWSFAGGTL